MGAKAVDAAVDKYQVVDHGGAGALRSPLVSAVDLPTPGRMIQHASPLTEKSALATATRREFAELQATAANIGLQKMDRLGRPPTALDWAAEHRRLTVERAKQPESYSGSTQAALTPLTDEGGFITHMGLNIPPEGAKRDPETGKYELDPRTGEVAGQATPASIVRAEAGRRAHARFGPGNDHIDELQNTVRLTDGTTVNSNRLVRGERGTEVNVQQREYQASRGKDVSQWASEIPADRVMSVPALQADREKIRQDAYEQLANPGEFTIRTWADAAYKLFLSPEMRSGNDAVSRTLLAEAGAYHLGRVPTYPHDIDFFAMTVDQDEFIDYIVEHDRRMQTGEPVWGSVPSRRSASED